MARIIFFPVHFGCLPEPDLFDSGKYPNLYRFAADFFHEFFYSVHFGLKWNGICPAFRFIRYISGGSYPSNLSFPCLSVHFRLYTEAPARIISTNRVIFPVFSTFWVPFFFIGTNRVLKNARSARSGAYFFIGTFWVIIAANPLFSVLSGYISIEKTGNQPLFFRKTPKTYEYRPDFTRNV